MQGSVLPGPRAPSPPARTPSEQLLRSGKKPPIEAGYVFSYQIKKGGL